MQVPQFSVVSGRVPPHLGGRDEQIGYIRDALAAPTFDGATNMLIVGLRGTGKTSLLRRAERIASDAGWVTVSAYLDDDGLLDRMSTKLEALSAGPAPHRATGTKLAGAQVSALGFGAGVTMRPTHTKLTIDAQIEAALARTEASGLLITIDEVHATVGAAQRHLRALGNEIQLAQGRGLPVVAMMAGLPGGIRALLPDRDENNRRTAATFLRRARRVPIGAIPLGEVATLYENAARAAGLQARAVTFERLAEVSGGYPYFVQLLGHHIWPLAEAGRITDGAVTAGAKLARRDLAATVRDIAFGELSPVDQSFLLAMAQWPGETPVPVGFIREQLDVAPQYVNTYRQRLLDAEMIAAPVRGRVSFVLPYMREMLLEHAATGTRDDDWPIDWRDADKAPLHFRVDAGRSTLPPRAW